MKPFKLFPLLCIIAGCRAYTPAPIDWAQERAAWAGQSAEPLRLTLADAKRYALFLNPEINALRVRHLASSNVVLQTGWWDDPEIGVDALRFLKRAPHPWIVDSTLAFTIPVNGVPALERKAAEAYTFADACAVIAEERALMTAVERAWNVFQHTGKRCQFLADFLKPFEADNEKVKKLVAAGELDVAEGARINLDILRMAAEGRQARNSLETQRLALLRLMGFHPSVPLYPSIYTDDDEADPAIPTEDTLLRHPNVQEKLARLGASEADLRTEIRRQYPDLKIGPALQNEDGASRAGLTFGMTLPLWNRNRKAIAEAEGARQHARIEAVNEWKRLVAELELAKAALRAAEENEQRSLLEKQVAWQSLDCIEQLYRAGEADIVACIVVRQTCVTAHLNLLDASQALREAQISVRYFSD